MFSSLTRRTPWFLPAALRIFEGMAMTFRRNVARPNSFDLEAEVVVDGMVDVDVVTIGVKGSLLDP